VWLAVVEQGDAVRVMMTKYSPELLLVAGLVSLRLLAVVLL
jgi:hypothetical protein